MPREYTVCAHPHRLDVEAALAAGLPAAQIAPLFGLSADALLRHRAAHGSTADESGIPVPLCPSAPLLPGDPNVLAPASLVDHLRSLQSLTLLGIRAALT